MDTTILQNIKQRYGIVGNSDGLNHALEVAVKVARVDMSVLVTGENGTGKEVLPRIIHDSSTRARKKYFAINCGAIPEGTIDSELFGHEKGSFTGSIDKREGYFATADGGTLFLDEVGELPPMTQVRLLRVLETGEYIPVGASEVRKTNVRIVAATNLNLPKAIREGKFREDLYYRLSTITIELPPLRERGKDIELLFRKFALDLGERYRMPPVRLDKEAVQLLLNYPWPGNIRQLRHLVEYMSVISDEREITADVLRTYLPADRAHTQVALVGQPAKTPAEHSYEREREMLYKVLFDLRRDVDKLKEDVAELKQGGAHTMKPSYPFLLSHMPGRVEDGDLALAEEVMDDDVQPRREPEGNASDEPLKGPAENGLRPAQPQTKEELEKELIRKALIRSNGRRKLAAEQIGISERTLYRKIKEYGLDKV